MLRRFLGTTLCAAALAAEGNFPPCASPGSCRPQNSGTKLLQGARYTHVSGGEAAVIGAAEASSLTGLAITSVDSASGGAMMDTGCVDLNLKNVEIKEVASSLLLICHDVVPGINMELSSTNYVAKDMTRTGEKDGMVRVNIAPGTTVDFTIKFQTDEGTPIIPEPCVSMTFADLDCDNYGCEELTLNMSQFPTSYHYLACDTLVGQSVEKDGSAKFWRNDGATQRTKRPFGTPLTDLEARVAVQFNIGGVSSFDFKFYVQPSQAAEALWIGGHGGVGQAPDPVIYSTPQTSTTVSAPTAAPTAAPSAAPTAAPTKAPTAAPTKAPTAAPTKATTTTTTTAFLGCSDDGFELAMRFSSSSQFVYSSPFWTNDQLMDASDPTPAQDADGKFAAFTNVVASQVRGCLPHGCMTYTLTVPDTLLSLFSTTPDSSSTNVRFGSATADAWAAAAGATGLETRWKDTGVNYVDDKSTYQARVRFGALFNNEGSVYTANDAVGFGATEASGAEVGAGWTRYRNLAVPTNGTIWVSGSGGRCATAAPTKAPTAAPTAAPSAAPTKAPTAAPTAAPTKAHVAVPHFYVVDHYGSRIEKCPADLSSPCETVFGHGGPGGGDTKFNSPAGLELDQNGNVIIADAYNHRIQLCPADAPQAPCTTVAGGTQGGSSTQLNYPYDVVVDAQGDYVIADKDNHRIQLCPAGAHGQACTTVVGGHGVGPTELRWPEAVAIDNNGDYIVSDTFNERIQKCPAAAPGAPCVTVAGNAGKGSGPRQLNGPWGVTVDKNGDYIISDYYNKRVQKCFASDPGGDCITVVGGMVSTQLGGPRDAVALEDGNYLISDWGGERVLLCPPGAAGPQCTTITSGYWPMGVEVAPGGPVTPPSSTTPAAPLSFDYMITDHYGSRIVKCPGDLSSPCETVFGFGGPGGGDTQLNSPAGLALDQNGDVIIGDSYNHRIQLCPADTPQAPCTTVAGGTQGGSSTQLNYPYDVVVDAQGDYVIADKDNHRIQLCPAGAHGQACTTVVGGHGVGPTELRWPEAVAIDNNGDYIVSDTFNERIQKCPAAAPGAPCVTVAGNAGKGSGPRQLNGPWGVTVDKNGDYIISDYYNKRVQKCFASDPGGDCITVVGGMVSTQLGGPKHAVELADGDYLVSDWGGERVLKCPPGAAGPTCTTITSGFWPVRSVPV